MFSVCFMWIQTGRCETTNCSDRKLHLRNEICRDFAPGIALDRQRIQCPQNCNRVHLMLHIQNQHPFLVDAHDPDNPAWSNTYAQIWIQQLQHRHAYPGTSRMSGDVLATLQGATRVSDLFTRERARALTSTNNAFRIHFRAFRSPSPRRSPTPDRRRSPTQKPRYQRRSPARRSPTPNRPYRRGDSTPRERSPSTMEEEEPVVDFPPPKAENPKKRKRSPSIDRAHENDLEDNIEPGTVVTNDQWDFLW